MTEAVQGKTAQTLRKNWRLLAALYPPKPRRGLTLLNQPVSPPTTPAWVENMPDDDTPIASANEFKLAMMLMPKFWRARLNTRRIAFQWAMVAIVALGLVWTLGDKRSVTSRDEE